MNISCWSCTPTRCNMIILIIFLANMAETAINLNETAFVIEILRVDKSTIRHLIILNEIIYYKVIKIMQIPWLSAM